MRNKYHINLKIAHHKTILWICAIIITIGAAVFQRLTGPTYPVKGEIKFDNQKISYKFLRSQIVQKDVPIKLTVPDRNISGYVEYRRYKSYDKWRKIPLQREGKILRAYLPAQPPAGKLMYKVYLTREGKKLSITGDNPIIIRYKGSVPLYILIPHVFVMFFAMLISNRTALESLDNNGNPKKFMLWTIGTLLIGGFILGPLVQKYAFGAFWTGLPFGYDLTDNKTLIAMIGWLGAWYKNRRDRKNRGWIFFAAVLMFAIYLIPHSVLGSEIDYRNLSSNPALD